MLLYLWAGAVALCPTKKLAEWCQVKKDGKHIQTSADSLQLQITYFIGHLLVYPYVIWHWGTTLLSPSLSVPSYPSPKTCNSTSERGFKHPQDEDVFCFKFICGQARVVWCLVAIKHKSVRMCQFLTWTINSTRY